MKGFSLKSAAGSEYGLSDWCGRSQGYFQKYLQCVQVCSKQNQSCSSGKKLEPAVWKFAQRLKTLSASSSSPSSRRSLDLEGSRPSVEEEVALKCPTCGLLRRLQSQGPSSRGFEPLARARAKARASRPRALLLHQLLKKLQQILKAIPGRKLALWRALQQSLFLLRLPQLPRRFCLECMTSLVCLWKHSLQRAARGSIRTQ